MRDEGSGPSFTPHWASPPGDTILKALSEQRMSLGAFAASLQVTDSRLRSLITGETPISIDLARRIGSVIGGTVPFWIARDGQYRDDVARIAADAWAKALPMAQMAAFGWVRSPVSWQDRIAKALDFFAVQTVEAWQRDYGSLVAAAKFRFAASARLDEPAVAAWLRQAEIEAAKIEAAPYDREAFRTVLSNLRPLTLQRDPRRFVPELVAACAAAGVRVVVVRSPRGCPASGAARFLASRGPLIVLSARYRTDDHLWFSFFHEAAHVLLHDTASTYVDEFLQKSERDLSGDEEEADEFAADLLIPASLRQEAARLRPVPRDIVRFARAAGVSPGVVVGQMQHEGTLGFGTALNGFKRRYKWSGPTLERA